MKMLNRFPSISLAILGLVTVPNIAFAEEGFYTGLNLGYNSIQNTKSGSNVAGGNKNGTLVDIDGDNGLLLGAAVGYKFSDTWRADISYTRLNNDLAWGGVYGSSTAVETTFKADTISDVLLLNAYLHGKGLYQETFDKIDPFISVGIGFAKNKMQSIKETSSTGTPTSDVDNGSKTSSVIRLGVGVDASIAPALTLTSSIDVYWLGDFNSGDSRDTTFSGLQDIGAWQIDDVVTYTASVGLRYAF